MVLPTGDGKGRRRSRPLWKDPTMILLGLTGAVDAADGRVLTALFRALESEFSFGPETLSYLLIGQSLSMAVSSPLWGYLADRKSRAALLAMGCFMCGFSTWLMAGATTFFHLLVMRSLAGIALASISPVGQSLVADLVPERNRGRVYGILMAVSNAGAFWGGLFATSYGGRRIFSPWSGNSISGWRFVLVVVGSLPLLLSIVVYLIMSEPRRTFEINKGENNAVGKEGTFHFLKRLFRVRTFQLIVLQGLFGAIPWNALSFSTLWLQHAGFDDFTASKIVSWHMIGAMFGVALGGQLGDAAAIWSPSRGFSGTLGVTRAYVSEVTPKGVRTLYLAYVAAVMYAGFTITPFLGAALVWYFGEQSYEMYIGGFKIVLNMYTAPAFVLLLVNVMNLLALTFLLKHRRREMMPKIKKGVSSRMKAANRGAPGTGSIGQERTAFGMTKVDAIIWFTILLNVVSKGCISTYETLGVKLAKEIFDIPATTVGVTLSCCGIIGVILLLSFKKISRFVEEVDLIPVTLLISVLGIASMTDMVGEGLSKNRFITGFFLVFGIGFPISDTAIVGIFSKVVGNKPQGTLQGLLACSSAISRMVVPIMASYVSHYISTTALFLGINFVLVCSAGVVFYQKDLLKALSS